MRVTDTGIYLQQLEMVYSIYNISIQYAGCFSHGIFTISCKHKGYLICA